MSTPTAAELVARARALGPKLKERAAAADAARKLPAETIRDFHEAGLFKILQPKCWGGFEMDPQVFFDVQMALGEACTSSGWVFGIIAVHNFQLGLFDIRAQEEVWSKDNSVLIASSYQPVGKVERVDGGFKLTGRWSFSSGCDHCDWIFLGSIIPPAKEGDPPDMRTFLLPKSDYKIVDTWHTFGLKATGSNDIVVEGAFIPEHRTHKAVDGFLCTNPGQEVNTGPLFRMPWAQIFVRSISTASIGGARGALNAYAELAKGRVSTNTGKATKTDAVAQAALAKAAGEIDEMDAVLHRSFDQMMALLREGKPIPLEDRIRYRFQSANVARRCADLVDGLIVFLGGRAIFNTSPIVRYWLDLNAARTHVANDPGAIGGSLAGTVMGENVQEFFV
jgi:3-hydroxy-9,10-secoandrosta-1,3,5(10)-triene-9,17-dione monooxygenase